MWNTLVSQSRTKRANCCCHCGRYETVNSHALLCSRSYRVVLGQRSERNWWMESKGFQRRHEWLNMLRFPVHWYWYKYANRSGGKKTNTCNCYRCSKRRMDWLLGHEDCSAMFVPTCEKTCVTVDQQVDYYVRTNNIWRAQGTLQR